MKQPSYLKGGLLLLGVALVASIIFATGNFGFWLAVAILALSCLILLYSLAAQIRHAIIRPARRLYAKAFSLKLLATLMGFFLVSGTLQYLFVFYTIEQDSVLTEAISHRVFFSNAEYLLRSLICSLDLFMLDVDSNILDRLDGHAALKGLLTVQAVFSFACTIAMLVGLVYSRLHAYYSLNYATKINDTKNHLYLFFGNNEPTELLIRDIVKNDPKALAIIIDEANIKDDDNDEWDGIVGLIAHKRKVFHTADKIGAYVAIASQQLVDIDDDITSREDFDAFGYLGLPKIKKFIHALTRTSNPHLHIFFMEDDEELNIRNIIALAKDSTIMAIARNNNLYHRIYCHARYNGPNRVVQDVALKKHLNVKIVDSSHIAIELLKLDPDCHPVNVVKTSLDNPTTVETPLKTLIVGFGEVGRDAFRFLYEFGAFVNSTNESERSPFECVIVDKNLNDIKGTFISSMPGIFKYNKATGQFMDGCVRFENINYCSPEFYSSVILKNDFLKTVNYIIISIGNNDESISLASRIFNLARRERDNLANLRIFVRCTDNNKIEGIQKIADHYNYGYGNGEKNIPVIRIFGQPERTYTYDLVVSDRLIEEGKQFHEQYRVLSGEGNSWDSRHKQLSGRFPSSIEQLRKLRRQESQDNANALHAGTKMILLRQAISQLWKDGNIDWHSFCLRYFNTDGSANVTGSRTNIRYPALTDKENEIILHLAQLEHLRWNAAHELLGYEFHEGGTYCDERTMRHNCLCPWNLLDKQSDLQKGWICDYKKYDFCVVDTTIALNKDNLLYPKSDD